jgi:hypothetical protein
LPTTKGTIASRRAFTIPRIMISGISSGNRSDIQYGVQYGWPKVEPRDDEQIGDGLQVRHYQQPHSYPFRYQWQQFCPRCQFRLSAEPEFHRVPAHAELVLLWNDVWRSPDGWPRIKFSMLTSSSVCTGIS